MTPTFTEIRHHDARAVVVTALYCDGWSWSQQGNGSIVLHADDGVNLLVPNNTGLKENVWKSWINKILRHATRIPAIHQASEIAQASGLDPHHARLLEKLITDQNNKQAKPTSVAHDTVRALAGLTPERVASIRQGVDEAHQGKVRPAAEVLAEITPQPEPEPEPVTAEPLAWVDSPDPKPTRGRPTVVSQRPARPRRNYGRTYESKAAWELTMSDGSILFECAHPGCKYRGEKLRSVSSHYAHTHSLGKGRQPQGPIIGISDQFEVTRRRTARISRLTREITAAWESGARTPEAIATWVVDRRIEEAPEPAEERDLTPEEVIERIAALVGGTSRAEYLRMELRLAEMESRAVRAENALRTLGDLATEAVTS
jgi:hypothetical protein